MNQVLSLDDTIAAIATPIGTGGIGIVRLSGPQALVIADSLFQPRKRRLQKHPRHLCYGWIVDPHTQEHIDEVLAVYMPAPHTYTRQDVVEINAHGGPLVVRKVLALCLQMGARAAEPGEMTLRAFVNGRIDLTQAEAVHDLISARTEAALRQAVHQLEGRLAERVRQVRRKLLHSLATVEAAIDFDDEETSPPDITAELRDSLEDLQALLATASAGIIKREGLRVAIVGRPNVGKSSLMNALLGTDRAIVTPIPGTTRDTLEEVANIGGVAIVFVDTAGLAGEMTDPVGQMGMARTRRALQTADMALFVLDGSETLRQDDLDIASLVASVPAAIIVWNKADLPAVTQLSPLPGWPEVRVSALTGEGLPELEMVLLETALGSYRLSSESCLSSERQRNAVERAIAAVQTALEGAQKGMPPDILALDVKLAADALGEITGETASDELLALIFSSFCVGK
ncbi:MAG: tRNA uridine-5-carboxymethylaminomethyl(34) synthesis GTPase MnmE [Anaerolineae bacterium]